VDPVRDEVVLTDESLHQLMVYDRLANTPPTAAATQPKRVIGGLKTDIEYAAQLHIDPANGDIYATDNDTHNRVVMFSRQAKGNVPPDRQLYAPHTTFGLAVDEAAQELYVTEQLDSVVVVWKKTAQKGDSPVRLLQGDRTRLEDPHGIAFDTKNRLMFVTNFGSVRRKVPQGGTLAQTVDPSGRLAQTSPAPGIKNWPVNQHIPGSGKKLPPSITIHALDAQGDTAPLRTIEGPKTQLNWPTGIAFEPKRNELYVANDTGDAVLVFNAAASGDVAPVRILKGPKSLIKNPLGVFVDTKNDELWVANFGNHTATVYKTTAAGDTPPLRVIRSTPLGQAPVMLGNPGSITYDSKRDELLVPN
jgi:DNA-binding beta-propeller fold protein YncE